MKIKSSKIVSHVTLSSLLLSLLQGPAYAADKNAELAQKLLFNLKKKIDTSVTQSRKGDLELWDSSKMSMRCLDDEIQFQDMQAEVILPLQRLLRSKNTKDLKKISASDYSSQSFTSLVEKSTRTFDGIKQATYIPGNQSLSLEESVVDLNLFLESFKAITFSELTAEKYVSIPSTRAPSYQMKDVQVSLRYDIRGEGKSAKRLVERGILNLKLTKSKTNTWKIGKVEIASSERLSTGQKFFENITESSKVAQLVPSHLRREAIRRGGYAMAAQDFKGDNQVGLFVATVNETVLLSGSKDLVFNKVKSPVLEKQTLVKSATFADLKNTGKQDLILVRFAPNESQTKEDRSDIQVYENQDGNYNRKEKVIKFNANTAFAMPMALADFNNDSFLDFYVGFPGAKDFTTLLPAVHKKDLATQGVFYNQKNGTFKDDPYKSFEKIHANNLTEVSKIFPHSALAVDFNNDTQMDLVVVDDRGNLSPVYTNKGGGNFEYNTTKIGDGFGDYGMGIDAADFNGDGKLDFVMSSVNFNSNKRMKESCETNWSVQNTMTPGNAGLRLFQANNDSTAFVETTAQNGLSWVGEGAAGVKVLDYNNDGFPDIYLTNGLWTGSEKDNSQDIAPYFVGASHLGILEDNLKSELKNQKFNYGMTQPNREFNILKYNSDSQSSIMDLLSFYRGDLRSPSKKSTSSLSLAGNQANRMFRNNGDGTFTEVGFLLGVDSLADGYMAATASLERNGQLDLILRNADPGYDVKQHAPVEIFKNTGAAGNNGLALKLVGNISNRDAIGAIVEGKIGRKLFYGQVLGNSGTVQSEKLVHFGLGKNNQMDEIKITWPSGQIQKLTNIKAGFHEVREMKMQISSN